ncbi:hypothetical protein KUTeg_022516 [Tegillarca granosa]|uniref:Glycerophosphocholine phosphodiesterase GPCPD1 n=1 Tax=Tegillarca granosa TaxID=220873 RepID=A0ABQ9E6S0_TEGGR|nr:hypothetical protein KUTeg_022516 [Tegillarca granosa]
MMSITFELTFSVLAETEPGESVCVVGDCERLGKWDPCRAVVLTMESSPRLPRKTADGASESSMKGHIWRKKIKFNGMQSYKYRFFIARIHEADSEESDKVINVIRWETNINPREFSPKDYMNDPKKYDSFICRFGDYGGTEHITKGWLIDQSELQIRLHSNPIHMWKPKHRKQTYRIKCTPLDYRYSDHLSDDEEDDYPSKTMPPSTFTKVYAAVMEEGKDTFRVQDKYGQVYNKDDYMIFSARTLDPEYLGFHFDFYVHETDSDADPKHVGYCYLLPVEYKYSNDVKNIPITGLKHRPIVDYLIAKPVTGINMSMEVSYQKYWKLARGPLDVGHRGMGSSYKHKKLAAIRENTIESLQSAGSHVILCIYLRYEKYLFILPSLKKKRHDLQLFQISVKDLTLAELQSMKRCFEAVDQHVGFNIEVKYPLQNEDGVYEETNFFGRNKYVDTILKTVFESAGERRIVFSSFDPDTCTLLRLKQNKYPVLFLTNGETKFYKPYKDPRCKSVQKAIHVSKITDLLGVDVFSEVLIEKPECIKSVKDAGLILFCWGEHNNDSNTINSLKENGIDGIIYDRIDHFKPTKTSIFSLEQQKKKELLDKLNVVTVDPNFSNYSGTTTDSEAGKRERERERERKRERALIYYECEHQKPQF